MPVARRAIAVVLLASVGSSTTGCATWKVESGPLPAVLEKRPSSLKVRTADSTWVLRGAALVSDTLTGTSVRRDGSTLVRVATADVRSVATRQPNALRTLLLTAGIVVGAAAALVAALYAWTDQG